MVLLISLDWIWIGTVFENKAWIRVENVA
jgi:hypothetical protein